MSRAAIGMVILLAGAAATGAAQSSPAPPAAAKALADYSMAMADLARTASPAVVQIHVRSLAPLGKEEGQAGFVAEQEATGSGVIVDPEGYIVTNAHVVRNARRIEVNVLRTDEKGQGPHGHLVPAKLVGLDRQVDIAVVKIEGQNYPTLQFVNSDDLRQGQLVMAMGSPLGLQNSLTHGVVSATLRQLSPESPMVYIQTDAPINPGNSGGPLLDIVGRIAGINTMIFSESGGNEGIGFAIPSNLAQDVYQRLRKEGRVRRGVIGVIAETITSRMSMALGLDRDSGVILSDVTPEGPAGKAGLQPGDVVLAIDGKPMREARDLVLAIFQGAPGDQLHLDVDRGGQRMPKTVTLMERPAEPSQLEDLANTDATLVRQLGILALTVDRKVLAIMTDLRQDSGVAVAAIPAEYTGPNPGLAAGDVIHALNKTPIASIDQLQQALNGMKPGDPIVVTVEREGQLIYVTGTLE